MITITREQLYARVREKVKGLEFSITQTAFSDSRAELEEELELARIALASLEAEPVFEVELSGNHWLNAGPVDDSDFSGMHDGVNQLYSAPPVPLSVPAAYEHTEDFSEYHEGWNACRAAMLQGAEPVTTDYKLPDDFDFDRFNDVVWLEAVASNPHMHSLTTSTIAMVALELNRKLADCNFPVIPDGLRLALSNAGIAAPESDEMLAATCEKHIQALVTWVKERKPFRSAVNQDGWVACSERMPEVGVKVLCFPVNDEPIHATYNGQVWLQDISWSTSDEPIDNVISCNVFHWMPLPAAPQQEVE